MTVEHAQTSAGVEVPDAHSVVHGRSDEGAKRLIEVEGSDHVGVGLKLPYARAGGEMFVQDGHADASVGP